MISARPVKLPAHSGHDPFRTYRFLILTVVLLLSCTATMALRTPFGVDEIFTFTVSSQPGLTAVWKALLNGADNHAPLDYLLRHLSLYLPVQPELALRIPSLIGFSVFCSCMFLFVQRRAGFIPGVCAFFIPLTTAALKHAFEARSYATLLGFAGVAIVAWQSLDTPRRTWLKVVAFALALTGAILCHYYAVLLYLALLFAELFRWYWFRAVRLSVIVGFACTLPGILIVFPFARAASAYAGDFWTPVYASMIPVTFAALYGTGVYLILVLAALLALSPTVHDNISESDIKDRDSGLIPDIVLGLTLTSTVLFCFIAAVTVTRAFYYRYAIVGVGGLCILLPLLLAQHAPAKRNRYVLLAATLALACMNVGYRVRSAWHDTAGPSMRAELQSALAAYDGPIIWGETGECLPLTHYYASIAHGRIFCVTGLHNSATVDRGVVGLAPWANLPIRSSHEFLAMTPRFAIVHPESTKYEDVFDCPGPAKKIGNDLRMVYCTAGSDSAVSARKTDKSRSPS